MIYVISVMLACAVSVESKNTSSAELSPPMVEKPAVTKVELPRLLGDAHIVKEPGELLKTLRDTQQQAWEGMKTVKVRAWYRFHNNKGPKPVTWLLDYAHTKNPAQFKELKFNSNKMMQEAVAGRKYDPVGVDANDKDAWYCLNASIATPDMLVKAMFTKHMRPDSKELLTIFPADKKRSTGILEQTTRRFGFAMSPKEFYDTELPRILKAGGALVVRRNDNLVELDFTDPEDRRTPRKIYRFDLSKQGSAVVIYDRSRRAEIELHKVEDHWLPLALQEQNMNRYIEMDFFDWILNADLDGEHSLKTLPMAEGTVVNDKRVTPPARAYFRDWEE